MVGSAKRAWAWGLLFMAGVVLTSSCSGSSTETTTAPPATATTAPTTTAPITTVPPTTQPTTTSEPETTTTVDPMARPDKLVSNFDRASVDDFDTTGDNLYRIALELADLFNYLEGHPLDDPAAMVDLMFERGYPFRDGILRDFKELTDNNWHYIDEGIHTVAIDVIDVEGDRALVKVADMRGEQTIADESGEVVKVYPGWSLDAATFTLNRGDDNRWRYQGVGDFLSISDTELAEMVPVEWIGRNL